MNKFEKTFEVLQNTELNWNVIKKPLFTEDGLTTESNGLFRSDNNKWLGTVGNQYEVYQNSDLVETIVEASSEISNEIKGGYLKQGKKVFLQIALPDSYVANDTVKRYITALNSHDGTSSIAFGSTNTVVVCQNSFYRAHKKLSKIRHTMTAKQKVSSTKNKLIESLSLDNELITSYERMTDFNIDKPIFAETIHNLFKEDVNVKEKEISTRKKNQMKEFNNVLDKELESHGKSLWGLFNAVTYYTNHIKPKKSEKDEYIMVGEGARLNLMTYESILNYMDSKKRTLVSV